MTDFEIAAEQFGRYLEGVDGHYSAIRELRGHLQSNFRRSEEKLLETVSNLGGGYNWQATDSTFQSISPSIISDSTLRRELVEFHDGFMPFMLNLSNRYQESQSIFRDVLYDDFGREMADVNETRGYTPPTIRIITPVGDIPSHGEFYEKMDNYEILLRNLKRRIPEALQRIDVLENKIVKHMQTL